MNLIDEMKKRFIKNFSRETLESGLFWKVALLLENSGRVETSLRADRLSLRFFLNQTADAYLHRRPVVWANLILPPELLHGSMVTPFYPEVSGAIMAKAGLSERFLERADAEGFSRDLCSFHRATLGAALEDLLPRPDLLLSASYPCDSGTLSFSFLADLYRVPHIIFDLPTHPEEEGLSNLELQLSSTADELSRLAGLDRSLVHKSLRNSIRLSNQAREYLLEVEALRQQSPCPLNGWDALGHLAAITVMMGTEDCVHFYRELAAEVEERQGKPVNGVEKHRLLWIHLRPYYPNNLGEHLEESGASIVCEELNHCFWEAMDPSNPFPSLARKMAQHFYVGPAERRARQMVKMALQYDVDAVVHFQHRGCRQSCGCSQLVLDQLSALGVRTLALEGDCIDPREYREGQTLTRIDALLETL